MDPVSVFRLRREDTLHRRELVAAGCTPNGIARAIHTGRLVRVRRGWYCLPGVHAHIQRAVRVGGRATCISAAQVAGLWVPPHEDTHISMQHRASRLRNPDDRFARRDPDDPCELHWWPPSTNGKNGAVAITDALAHVMRCQDRLMAVAVLDSAIHERLVRAAHLDVIFAEVPARLQALRPLLDGRAESGLESVARTLIRDVGLRCEPQVVLPGIGRCDLLVEDCVVVETDGVLGHDDSIESRRRHYERDAAVASRGITPLRFRYAQVLHRPEEMMAAVIAAVRSHRRGPAL